MTAMCGQKRESTLRIFEQISHSMVVLFTIETKTEQTKLVFRLFLHSEVIILFGVIKVQRFKDESEDSLFVVCNNIKAMKIEKLS